MSSQPSFKSEVSSHPHDSPSEKSARPLFFHALLILALALVVHGLYFTIQNRKDQQYLREVILPQLTSGTEEHILLSALEAAFHLPPHRSRGNQPDYGIEHPLLKALGPPASLIHQHGGHCGRRSRLLMAILKEKGIETRKVHLINLRYAEFNHSHHYVHAVVEARINDVWVVADPLYNLVYRKPSGDLASIDDIRKEPVLVFQRGVAEADTRFAPYFSELYTYDDYRKFIWNSIPGGERLYGFLRESLGEGEARELTGLHFIETPLKALALASYVGAIILFAAAGFWRFRYKPSVAGRTHNAPGTRKDSH